MIDLDDRRGLSGTDDDAVLADQADGVDVHPVQRLGLRLSAVRTIAVSSGTVCGSGGSFIRCQTVQVVPEKISKVDQFCDGTVARSISSVTVPSSRSTLRIRSSSVSAFSWEARTRRSFSEPKI